MSEQRLLSLLLLAWVWPALAAVLAVLGLHGAAAVLAAACVTAVGVIPLASRLPTPAQRTPSGSPWYIGICAVFLSLSVVGSARLSIFMADPSRTSTSVVDDSAFYTAHSCLTAATGALDRIKRNESMYRIPDRAGLVAGRFEPDAFIYPSASLLLPFALGASRVPFLSLRAEMFAVQSVAMLGAMLGLALYIGGSLGMRVLWSTPAVALAPAFLVTMQIENLHVLVFALAMGGMAALASGRRQLGAALLATTITAKLFPAVLLVYLAARRRWTDVAVTTAWIAGLVGVSVLLWGVRPYQEYLGILPGIMSGTSPTTAIWIDDFWLAPGNHSALGALRKLAALGVPHLSPWRQEILQTLYGLAVLAIAAVCGLFGRNTSSTERDRWREAVCWLALLNLASFRSPFLPDGYAYLGAFWFLALVFALENPAWRVALLTLGWLAMSPIFGGRAEAPQPFKVYVLISLVTQLAVVAATLIGALNLPVGWRRLRSRPALEPARHS